MNILFIDDHTIFRDGVSGFIQSHEQCDELVTVAGISEALDVLQTKSIDIVITDLNFPEHSGFELLQYLQDEKLDTPVLVLSMLDDQKTLQRVLQYGARGYVTKSSGFLDLSQGIEALSAGGYYFDQHSLRVLVGTIVRQEIKLDQKCQQVSSLSLLSDRQKEVFLLLAEGLSPKEVSARLCISTKTVENHRSQIYQKLEVKDRLELYKFAVELGLL